MFLCCVGKNTPKTQTQPAHLSLAAYLSRFMWRRVLGTSAAVHTLPDPWQLQKPCQHPSWKACEHGKLYISGRAPARTIGSIYCPVSRMIVITAEWQHSEDKWWKDMSPGDVRCVRLAGHIDGRVWCSMTGLSKSLRNLRVRALKKTLHHKYLVILTVHEHTGKCYSDSTFYSNICVLSSCG